MYIIWQKFHKKAVFATEYSSQKALSNEYLSVYSFAES